MMAQMVVQWRLWSRMAQHQCHQSLLPSREQRRRDRERSAPCTPQPPATTNTYVALSHPYARQIGPEPLCQHTCLHVHVEHSHSHQLEHILHMLYGHQKKHTYIYVCRHVSLYPSQTLSRLLCFAHYPFTLPCFPSSIFCLTEGVKDPHHNQSWRSHSAQRSTQSTVRISWLGERR